MQSKSVSKRSVGAGTPCLLRLHAPLIDEIDHWRARQPGIPTRAPAVLLLLETALAPAAAEPIETVANAPKAREKPPGIKVAPVKKAVQ